jgi:hypothetical protein
MWHPVELGQAAGEVREGLGAPELLIPGRHRVWEERGVVDEVARLDNRASFLGSSQLGDPEREQVTPGGEAFEVGGVAPPPRSALARQQGDVARRAQLGSGPRAREARASSRRTTRVAPCWCWPRRPRDHVKAAPCRV